MPKWRKTTVNGYFGGFYGLVWRSLCVSRCAFAFVWRKKGLFRAFGGVGRVFGCVWRVPWLLGAFLGERGRGGCPPLSFLVCSFGGVTSTLTVQNFFTEVKGSAPRAGFIYYTHQFREQKNLCKSMGMALRWRICFIYYATFIAIGI